MLHDVEFSTLFLYGVFMAAQANYDPHMDEILFSMNWPGPDMARQAADAVDQAGASVSIHTLIWPWVKHYFDLCEAPLLHMQQ